VFASSSVAAFRLVEDWPIFLKNSFRDGLILFFFVNNLLRLCGDALDKTAAETGQTLDSAPKVKQDSLF
jgi:hypothetical protein